MVERGGVIPTFAEGVRDVADRRSPELKLNIVPGRSVPVPGVEIDRLRVAFVTGVIPAAVAQVDPADEGDVLVRSRRATDDDELLMMASTTPDALVEKYLAARFVDLADELGVLLLAEVGLSWVRTPQKTAHVDAATREVGEHVPHRGARAGETLIRVALPSVRCTQSSWSRVPSTSYRRPKYSPP